MLSECIFPLSFPLFPLFAYRLLHSSHPFPCTVCGEAFKRRRELTCMPSLTKGQAGVGSELATDKEPVTCIHCSAQFVNQSVLDIHLQRCPTSEEDKNVGRGRGQGRGRCTGQMECDLCGHRCMTQEGLDLHRLSHTGQTPLSAPSFAYTSTFNVHMRTHTDERPFECATCGKRFRQLPHLQDHERIHSGLRPFCCWVCGKSFSVAARLTEHARTHSGEKPYACVHCPAAFRSRSNLDKHVRLHGDLPHEGAWLGGGCGGGGPGGGGNGTETVMISSEQLAAMDGSSQMVILPSVVAGRRSDHRPAPPPGHGRRGDHVHTGASPSQQHTIEFIVEETVV
ncbi:unnamed protein product [Boreogadus saida]